MNNVKMTSFNLQTVLLLLLVSIAVVLASNPPQQIHLSFGVRPDQMVVTWMTMRPTHHSHVIYGPAGQPPTQIVLANSTRYENPGKEHRFTYVHRAILDGLKPATNYTYQVASRQTLSQQFYFRSRLPQQQVLNDNKPANYAPGTFAIWADMGVNTTLINKLAMQAQRGDYLAMLHAGDIAYDLHKKNGRVGDEFMRQIQPVAAYSAYQVAAGNHERRENFSQYNARFSMYDSLTGQMNNHYYSFDEHLVHFVFYSSEFYFYPEFGTEQLQSQYNWLREDLRKANLPENRSKHPWIIAVAHRSMYCAGFDRKDCVHEQRLQRSHSQFPLEQLFQEFGVDLHLSGHEHAYSRFLPVYEKHLFSANVTNLREHHASSFSSDDDKINFKLLDGQEVDNDNEYDLDDNQPSEQDAELHEFYGLNKMISRTKPGSALYHNPPVMVNLITGAASNMPGEHGPPTLPPHWVATWSLEASYTRFTVYNSSYIYVQQLTGAPEGQDLLDELHLIKNIHGPIYDD